MFQRFSRVVAGRRTLAVTSVLAAAGLTFGVPGVVPAARADETITVTLSNHTFVPAEIKVPANKPFSVTIKNDDDAAEEIDSKDLKVEKVIAAKSTGTFHVKPLKPGTYTFSGEYHEATARGTVIAE